MARSLYPDELPPEAHGATQTFYEQGPHAGSVAEASTKVGWTLRQRTDGRILDGFAFLINPQGLTRSEGSRATLTSTKGGHFIDDFGPAAGRIQLRQLVASGKDVAGPTGYTAREDVQRFLKTIFLPATQGGNRQRIEVYFHDHHLERGFEQRVFFPPDALTFERSVELHGVWRLDLQMVSLEKYPYAELELDRTPDRTRLGQRYVCRSGDTLERLARRLAGTGASTEKVKRVRATILKLNAFITKTRTLADGRTAKPMRLHVGEILQLPR